MRRCGVGLPRSASRRDASLVKRCQVCGIPFDPDEPGGWACEVAYRGRHIPTDRLGTIYLLCFGHPLNVEEGDNWHRQPTSHYVGWTGQNPRKRVRQHGVPLDSIVELRQGTAEDEARIKREESCPRCGVRLSPECLDAR
jgi:hypothetical protein